TSTVSSYGDTGLTPATTYYYRVVATNAAGSSPPSAVVSAQTTPNAPAAPTGVTALAVNQTRVDVTWTDVSGATGYQVERSPDGSTGWSLVGTAGSGLGGVSDLGVTPGGTYFYRVLATNSGGTSPSSSVVSVTLVPPAPTGVTATAISSSRIDVSWGSATGATGYRVERSADGSTGWLQVATPNATSYSDTGLSAGATFYYRITATNSGGGSPTSAVAFATTLSGLPSPATGLRATNVLATSADLSWTDAAGESGYRIERSADGSTGWASAGTVAANVTVWSDSGLTPATTYFYRVIATNAAGDAAPSNVLALTTLPNPPGTPTGLTASTVSTSRIDLSWTATPDATGYRLERSLDGSTAWSQIAQQAVTSYSDTGLAPGTTYYYRVVATNAGGDSPPSAVASAATPPLAPNAPTGVAAAAASSSEIDVRWNLSSGATSYRLEVSTTGTSPWTLLATLGGTVGTYAHTALPPSTTYYYRVTAANTGGSSTPSATASATTVTRGCPCSIWAATATPTVLASTDATANELGLKFRTDVSGVVTGIRFYKGSTNTGTHVGHLWSRTGTVLATATFTNETSTGWQQVLFSSAVTVTAGTTYVASYYAPSGHYSVNNDFFATMGVTNAPLTALAAGVDGVNGVYRNASSGFPNSSYRSSNYWVDVVFTPTTPLAPTSPTVTGVTSSSISISWPDLSTETSYRVERSTDGVNGWTLLASTSQNATTYSDVALPASTTFYYRVLAINGGGTSPPSPSVAASTAASP
ncbi:MAG: DUF4082 domain-containing protein, partial [Actinomycetota bacterium]|nr:DUF4082 domain-containing protein [Actinomycetota bacterium]